MFVVAVTSLVSLYANQLFDGLSMKEAVSNKTDVKSESQKIKLFMYSDCYYCIKVTSFLQQHDLLDKVEFVDAYLPENRSLLRQESGRTQAPYLIDSDADVKMPESLDIIKYLAHKFDILI